MFSWLGFSGSGRRNASADDGPSEREPLLPDTRIETELQAEVHEKIRTYMVIRALANGYLPSTEQAVAHLRSLLGIDALNPANVHLTPSGRRLVRDVRRWVSALILLLNNKNSNDQLQEFLWCTSRARAGFDGAELVDAMGRQWGQTNAMNGYDAVRTVADLLMANKEFRRLWADLMTLARQVLSDTAEAGADAAVAAAETIRPTEQEMADVASAVPVEAEENDEDIGEEGDHAERRRVNGKDVAEVVKDGVGETAEAAIESTKHNLQEEGRGDALLERLKRAVLRLRGRTDYTESVSVISILIKRYAIAYSRSVSGSADTIASSVKPNSELDEAVNKFWDLITSFGDPEEWQVLTTRWNMLLRHFAAGDDLERLMSEIGNTIQDLLTDPDFADADLMEDKLRHLTKLAANVGHSTEARTDLDRLIQQAQRTFAALLADRDLTALIKLSKAIFANVWPTPYTINPDLASDLTHVLFPLFLQTIQYIPLLRVTISTPEIDLLIENLILQPGDTVNASSFFPYSLNLDTRNSFTLDKGRQRFDSHVESIAALNLKGVSVKADKVGYWMRAHTGPWRFWDEGIVSFLADGKGVDISLTVELFRERLEQLLTLRSVDIKINKLDYIISKSRFRWLAWPFKPILRPILRRILRKQLEQGISDLCHAANRELVYARERLRATRIAQPKSLWTFIRAVSARLTAPTSEDLDVAIGVKSSKMEKGVFEGRYAPGSIVKVWEEHGESAAMVIDVGAEGGWRNKVFDLKI